jgi:hypothetical protein
LTFIDHSLPLLIFLFISPSAFLRWVPLRGTHSLNISCENTTKAATKRLLSKYFDAMLKYKLRSSSLLLIYSEFDRAQSMRGLELVISSNQITQRFVQNIKFLQHSYIFFGKNNAQTKL